MPKAASGRSTSKTKQKPKAKPKPASTRKLKPAAASRARPANQAKPRPKTRKAPVQPVAYEPLCSVCRSKPVAEVTFESIRGYLLVYTREQLDGPFCRTCGEAAYRQTTARTLMWCWLGTYSFIFGIRAIIRNRRARKIVRALAEPVSDVGDAEARLNIGRPVWARPGGIIGMAAAAVVAFGIFAVVLVAASGPSGLYEDECVSMSDSTVEVVDCSAQNDGKVVDVIGTGDECPSGTDVAISLEDDPGHELCIDAP